MDRQAKIEAVMKAVGVTSEVAHQYLDAEEWSVAEAVFDIRAERKSALVRNLWSAAGYAIEDAGEFVPCAAKVIGAVRFHITDLEGTGLPHPDAACMAQAFDAEDHQYLELYREFPNRAALELALPDLAAEAAANRC